MTPAAQWIGACAVLASLAGGAVADTPATSLPRAHVAALRAAALSAPGITPSSDPLPIVEERLRSTPGLAPDEASALAERLRVDAGLRLAVLELVRLRLAWRSETRGRFVAWWDPTQVDDEGRPSVGLTAEDAAILGELLEHAAREQGIEAPSSVPYVLDLRARGARVRGPDDVRWGITTPSAVDRASVVKVVLAEIGDAPFVLEPLAALRACVDRECRRLLLDDARRTVIASGYVPIVEGLRATAFAERDDPAFASALLVVDHVDRLHPARTLGALLAAVPGAEGDLRGAFYRATGEPPGRLDRIVQAEIAEWARGSSRQR